MRLTASCLTAVAALTLSSACGDTSSPTALTVRSARPDIVATSTVGECVALIDALVARTSDPAQTPLTGKNAESKERPGLIAILTAARSLVEGGKPADAVKKLEDYIVKVENLADAGRLAPDIATSLIADARSVIACIQPASI